MDANLENAAGSATNESPGEVQPRTSERQGGRFRLPLTVHPLELLLVGSFLLLVFLLGIFPLKDTDFWWHLRTGDWILANGTWPRNDLYTYMVNPETRWIDLHWGFQVLLSTGYWLGGVPFLNLAKCFITTLAVAILLFGYRRPGWPLWVSIVSWWPALLVLSGRMYIRPETLSLLWIAIVLCILFHWRKHPGLMWFLPPIFLIWINTHGLFVLGFILIAFALVEAALDPQTWGRKSRIWWSRAIATVCMCVIACLFNPYGFRGMIFPLELAGTMGNPVFRSIGELTPLPQFIQDLGFREFPQSFSLKTLPTALDIIFKNFMTFPLPLQLHLATMGLAFLSFFVSVIGGFFLFTTKRSSVRSRSTSSKSDKSRSRRSSRSRSSRTSEPDSEPPGSRTGRSSRSRSTGSTDEPDSELPAVQDVKRATLSGNVRFSIFRLLAFVFFSVLSFQATRNSHQFAAIMGTITAANLAQWASLFNDENSRRSRRAGGKKSLSAGNAFAFVLIVATIFWVGSGRFYKQAGEGRTIGIGEEPLWFPHEAVKAAGQEGLPPRFASFHNGHAALYDYYWGPERKVFSDARLEVIGPNLYQDQMRLTSALNTADPSWHGLVAAARRPVMLADHFANSGVTVTLLASNDYSCIHFDAIASVFAPKESLATAKLEPFDFFNAHYSETGFRALRQPERKALARALRNISGGLGTLQRDDLARPMMLAGLGLTSRLIQEDPSSFDAWKFSGQLLQAGFNGPVKRERSPDTFVIETDLALVRSIYALKQAQKLDPSEFANLYSLVLLQRGLAQFDQEFETISQLVKLTPINKTQAAEIENSIGRLATLRQLMGLTTGGSTDDKERLSLPQNLSEFLAQPLPEPGATRAEIEHNVLNLLRDGQVRRAVETLNASLPVESAPTELLEKLGGLWLWLGEPDHARKAYDRIRDEPKRQTLLAVCWLIQNDAKQAMDLLQQANQSESAKKTNSELGFTIKSLITLIEMESGELAAAQKHFAELTALAKSPKQQDTINVLRRFLPVAQK